MTLEISRSVIAAILDESGRSSTTEVCGLLFGGRDRIDGHQPCANVADQPATAFEIDPAAVIAAYRAERQGGRRIVGCYHSHPSGDVMPSARDARAAAPSGWFWLIAAGDAVGVYAARGRGSIHGRFDPVDHRVVPSG